MSDLYRLERTLIGERLIEVTRPEEATHAAVSLLRRLAEERACETAALRSEGERARQRVRDLELQLGRATHHVDQAETTAAHARRELERLRADAERLAAATRKLSEKNTSLIGEKKRMREQLVAKHGLPRIAYRLEVDRTDQAYEQLVYILEAFPHVDHRRDALAEARRMAVQRGGRLRQLRLDTTAWRAVIHLPIEG